MLVATSLNLLYDMTPDIPRAVDRMAEAGFDALDFNGIDHVRDWVKEGGHHHVAVLRDAAEARGLPFVQAHGPMFGGYDDQCATHEALTPPCIRWCATLGVPWMVMHPFTVPGHHTWREQFDANVAWFRGYLPQLDTAGVGMAIENMSDHFSPTRRFGSTADELAELCDALNHPLIGLCWDTGHAHLQKADQCWSLAQMGQRLKVLHIQDNNGLSDDHILPFHGTINWDTVVAGLDEAGYQGAWTFEVHNGVRRLPDALRDEAMRLAVSIGRELAGRRRAG